MIFSTEEKLHLTLMRNNREDSIQGSFTRAKRIIIDDRTISEYREGVERWPVGKVSVRRNRGKKKILREILGIRGRGEGTDVR